MKPASMINNCTIKIIVGQEADELLKKRTRCNDVAPCSGISRKARIFARSPPGECLAAQAALRSPSGECEPAMQAARLALPGEIPRMGRQKKNRHLIRGACSFSGDPYGNRTHVTAVKGRCLNRLTNGPSFATCLL